MANKLGSGIDFKLPDEATANEVPRRETPPVVGDGAAAAARPRTGIGVIENVISSSHKAVQSRAGQLLDPASIRVTKWHDRHPDNFKGEEWEQFKALIRSSQGNVQAIKVRPLPQAEGQYLYEIVYGKRRSQACLELGLKVRALIEPGVTNRQLFCEMAAENRGGKGLSPWEQGVSYAKALDPKDPLFNSQADLCAAINLDPSNVSKALRLTSLPPEVVGAFASPTHITFAMITPLLAVCSKDAAEVLVRAKSIVPGDGLSGQEVFKRLTEVKRLRVSRPAKSEPIPLVPGASIVVAADGSSTIKLPKLDSAKLKALLDALQAAFRA